MFATICRLQMNTEVTHSTAAHTICKREGIGRRSRKIPLVANQANQGRGRLNPQIRLNKIICGGRSGVTDYDVGRNDVQPKCSRLRCGAPSRSWKTNFETHALSEAAKHDCRNEDIDANHEISAETTVAVASAALHTVDNLDRSFQQFGTRGFESLQGVCQCIKLDHG